MWHWKKGCVWVWMWVGVVCVRNLIGSSGGVLETTSQTVYKDVQLGEKSVEFCWARKMKIFRWHFHFSNCDIELLWCKMCNLYSYI